MNLKQADVKQWRIFAKIQLSTFEYKVWATPGANGPASLQNSPHGEGAGRSGEAASRFSKTFEFLYQFLSIFQHSKMQLFNSRCHHMWAIPCVHCNYHQTNQDGKTMKLNILPCTCIHMYFQPKYKSQITNYHQSIFKGLLTKSGYIIKKITVWMAYTNNSCTMPNPSKIKKSNVTKIF